MQMLFLYLILITLLAGFYHNNQSLAVPEGEGRRGLSDFNKTTEQGGYCDFPTQVYYTRLYHLYFKTTNIINWSFI